MVDTKPNLILIVILSLFVVVNEGKAEFNLPEVIDFLEENANMSIPVWELQDALQLLPLDSTSVIERKTTRNRNNLQLTVMKTISDGGLEFDSLIVMVNEDYVAVINRSSSDRSFGLVSLLFPSDEQYDTRQKVRFPWRHYLFAGGGALMIDELRSGEVLESKDDELEGAPVHIIKIKAIAKEHATGKPLWEVVRTFTFNRQSPFHLLRVVTEQKNELIRDIRFLDWTEQSGVHFPTKTEEVMRKTLDGPMVRGHQVTYSFTENIGDLDPKQTRLSYYGFPEPASPSANRLGFWLGLSALAIIGGIVFFLRRRESRRG